MFSLLLLVVGIAGLLFSTNIVIGNATAIARRFGWSDIVIGIVILAVGTDLPELVISINASVKNFQGHDLSPVIIGNALGSCFGQLVFTLGIAGLFARLTTSYENIRRHGSFAVISLVLLFLVALDGTISRLDGAILTVSFVFYLFLVARGDSGEEAPDTQASGTIQAILWLIVGLIILTFSADLAVDSVVVLARNWQVSEAVISIVILGMGTSLPELSLALTALKQKRPQLTVGNLVGSNIFDTLVPIGVAGLISPLSFKSTFLTFDLPILLVVTVIALACLGVKPGLVRWRAILLLTLYLGYAILRTGGVIPTLA
ncbi:MAG: calcium/sodium antiporter [Pseudomonadales bacterium]